MNMKTDAKIDRLLARVEPGRREAMRKILVSTAYTAPIVASFSLNSLAQGQALCANQPTRCPIPATSNWSLAALAGFLGASGAYLLRRRSKR